MGAERKISIGELSGVGGLSWDGRGEKKGRKIFKAPFKNV